jgi:hypothetical protein
MTTLRAGQSSTPRPDNPGAYQDNVTLTITFNRHTNRGGTPIQGVTKAQIDRLFAFDKNLGAAYTGRWDNCTVFPGKPAPGGCSVFVITVSNVSGASPPTVNGLLATFKSSGRLRDYPAGSEPATGSSDLIVGNFGPGSVRVTTLEARDDALLQPNVSVGDVLWLRFNMPTDRCVAMHACMHAYIHTYAHTYIRISWGQAMSLCCLHACTHAHILSKGRSQPISKSQQDRGVYSMLSLTLHANISNINCSHTHIHTYSHTGAITTQQDTAAHGCCHTVLH